MEQTLTLSPNDLYYVKILLALVVLYFAILIIAILQKLKSKFTK